MADIFISYAREDEERIKRLVSAFEAQGWTVFWDRRIPVGQSWRTYIGTMLEQARCILVVWSQYSVDSHWVIEEAEEGSLRNVLVPVLIDSVRPPRGFRHIQTADFSGWKGDGDSLDLSSLLIDLRRLLELSPPLEHLQKDLPNTVQAIEVPQSNEEPMVKAALPPPAVVSRKKGRDFRRIYRQLFFAVSALLVAVSMGFSSGLVVWPFGTKVDDITLLREFLFPDGKLNMKNRIILENYLQENKITTDVSSFLRLQRFEAARADAVEKLNLKQGP